MNDHTRKLEAKLKRICGKYGINQVFDDFLTLSFTSLANSVCYDDALEKEYLETVKKYSKEEVSDFIECFALLTLALEDGIDDILGKIYMSLGISNTYSGQFFTPFNVSCLAAQMTLNEKDFATPQKINDPCVGGGSMILAMCKVLYDRGINYQDKLIVIAQDIDIRCVKMTYIQLTLIGVMAQVIHGDALLNKTYATYTTPMCKIKKLACF